MVKASDLKAAVQKTAKQLGTKVVESTKQRRSGAGRIPAHKHCRMCGVTISANSEDRVCKEEQCITSAVKDDRVKKQLRIWMFIFMGFLLLPIISTLLKSRGVI